MSDEFNQRRMAGVAANGLLWSSIAVIVAKLASMVAQLALGYILDVETFGIFAMASIAMQFSATLQYDGISKLIIQQHTSDTNTITKYTKFSLYLGIVGSIILICMSFFLSAVYRVPDLKYIISLIALSIPLVSLSGIYLANGSVKREFRTLSVIDSLYNIAYNASLVLLAFFGADKYSIAFATILSCISRNSLYRYSFGKLNLSYKLGFSEFIGIFNKIKLIILAGLLFCFVQQGDYIALGAIVSKRDLAYYYFGFMLTANLARLITQGIVSIMLPLFASVRDQPARLESALFRSSSAVLFCSGVLALGLIGLLPSVVQWLWHGKWDAALITASAMALSLPPRMLTAMGTISLQAQGRWGTRMSLLIFDAVAVTMAAAIGGYFAGLNGAAWAGAIQRIVSGVIGFSYGVKANGTTVTKGWRFILRSMIPFILVSGPFAYIVLGGQQARDGYLLFVRSGETLVAIVAFMILTMFFDRGVLGDLYSAADRFYKRKRQ